LYSSIQENIEQFHSTPVKHSFYTRNVRFQNNFPFLPESQSEQFHIYFESLFGIHQIIPLWSIMHQIIIFITLVSCMSFLWKSFFITNLNFLMS